MLFILGCFPEFLINKFNLKKFDRLHQLPATCIKLFSIFFRYIFGPMNLLVCRFNYFLKLVLTTQAMLFLDGIIITRYALIFLVKNPAAIQDEFWSYYVNIWVYVFSWLTQFVSHLILGTDSNHIYLCTGQTPPSDTNLSQNLSLNNVIRILTVLIHISIVIKIQVFICFWCMFRKA